MSSYDSPTVRQHHAEGQIPVACGVVTVSDTRKLADDRSGDSVVELLEAAGHRAVERMLVADEPADLEDAVRELSRRPEVAAILITGGTGVAPRDQSPETLAKLFTRELPGFGELFRQLSFQEIGSAALASRATAGLVDRTLVFLMPGSTAAVRLAMERLIVPELGHLAKLAAKS